MQPALATSWSTSDDKLTWTFKLRQGVRFHDGTPFNAAAVKATFDRIRDPATASPRRSALAAITDIKVVDDHTIALVTKEPFAPLLAQISAYNLAIMSPAQLQKAGARYREQPAGTGPFKLKSWQPGERITLARNDDYWGEKAEARRAGDARGAGGFRARAAAAQRRGRRDRLGADRDAEAARSLVRREGDQEDRLPHHLCRPEQFAAAVQRPARARGGGACDRRQRRCSAACSAASASSAAASSRR